MLRSEGVVIAVGVSDLFFYYLLLLLLGVCSYRMSMEKMAIGL